MASSRMKPISFLKTRCNLSQFGHVSLLDPSNIFSSLWEGIIDLLILNTSYETLHDLLISTIYFFPQSQVLSIEKAHQKFIKEFSSVLAKNDPIEIKKKRDSADLQKLLQSIQELILPQSNNLFLHLTSIFKYTKISLVEKSEGQQDAFWGEDGNDLTIFVFRTKEQIYFLYPKDKLTFKSSENKEEEPDSPLAPCQNEDEVLKADEDSCEGLVEHPDSDEEHHWEETQTVLNKGNSPIIKNSTENSDKILTLQELNLHSKDLQRFSSAIFLDSSNFFTNLTLTLMDLFSSQRIFKVPLQMFTNSLYFFPFTHSKEFEKKHLKFTQDFIQAFSEEKLEDVRLMLKTEEIKKILDEIGNSIEKSHDSIIQPLFPLIKTWKIAVVEKSEQAEYYWNVKKPLATITLYVKNGQIYLLEGKNKFAVQELRIKNENLERIDASDQLQPSKNDDLIGFDDDDLLEVEPSEEITIDTTEEQLPFMRNVQFKPDLTIDIEKLRRDTCPSPTAPKSALKKDGRLSPLYQNRTSNLDSSPVLKYVEMSKKYNNPVERYMALAKTKVQINT